MVPRLIRRWLQQPLESLYGSAAARQRHHENLRSRPDVRKAIVTIQARWRLDPDPDDDNPILIFSAAWRSGSTLLQRLVHSGGDTLVWGEPYPYCDYIRRMASSLTSITANVPPDQFFLSEPPAFKGIDVNAWTACLYPHPQHLRNAHRHFFQTLYRDPARARGYARWGLKEVVLSTEDAVYLSWLFPAAKMVFLVRNPYDAWRSYRNFGDWYYRWPDEPVFTAKQFGQVWSKLAKDFHHGHCALGGMLVRHEDLASDPSVLAALSGHLGTTMRNDALLTKVTGREAGELQPIPRIELRQLRKAVEPLATNLGYAPGP